MHWYERAYVPDVDVPAKRVSKVYIADLPFWAGLGSTRQILNCDPLLKCGSIQQAIFLGVLLYTVGSFRPPRQTL